MSQLRNCKKRHELNAENESIEKIKKWVQEIKYFRKNTERCKENSERASFVNIRWKGYNKSINFMQMQESSHISLICVLSM